jgi:uncharacterized BrkB/YihY/UPF0761 family membrane protein
MTFKDLWELLQETWHAWSTHRAPRAGAALAYYTIFSLAPLLVIVIAVAALVFGQEAAQGKIVTEIQEVVGYFCPTPASVKSAAREGSSRTGPPWTCRAALSS